MEREQFLDRIAERLGRARLPRAPPREHVGVPEVPRQQPFGAGAAPDLAERFALELTRVGGESRLVSDLPSLHSALRDVLERWQAQRVVGWARPELAAFQLEWLWQQPNARAFGDAGV